MDADPYQIMVIEDAKAGYNLVVEGPPGTGKSQTIANIIAELLGTGKSVLFVSEKMAALEVVKSRLDRVGLGDFCLELHSRKTNKKNVLQELERSIKTQTPKTVLSQDEYDQLENLKTDLNAYVKALREPIGSLGRSPFELFQIKEKVNRHFDAVERSMPRVNFTDPWRYRQVDWTEAISRLDELSEVMAVVRHIRNHPWRGCRPRAVSPRDEEEINELIAQCQQSLQELEHTLNRLVVATGIKRPNIIEVVPEAISAAQVIAQSESVERAILESPEWDTPSGQAELIVNKLAELQEHLSITLAKFRPISLERDITSLLEEYKIQSARFFRLLSGRYRYLKREIAGLYKTKPPKHSDMIIRDLEDLIDSIKLREEFRNHTKDAIRLFGSRWQGEQSEPITLRLFLEWMVSFRQKVKGGYVTQGAFEKISTGVSKKQIEDAITALELAKKRFEEKRAALASRVGLDYENTFGLGPDKVSFLEFKSRMQTWSAELGKLQRWSQFVALRDECIKTIAQPIIDPIDREST